MELFTSWYRFFILGGFIWIFFGPGRIYPLPIFYKKWIRVESGLFVWLSVFVSFVMTLYLQGLFGRLGFISLIPNFLLPFISADGFPSVLISISFSVLFTLHCTQDKKLLFLAAYITIIQLYDTLSSGTILPLDALGSVVSGYCFYHLFRWFFTKMTTP